MKKYAFRLLALATVMLFGQAAGAENETAQRLFFEAGDGTKALFHSDSGTSVTPETGPGQDFSPENIGGLGGITNYYERLNNPGVMHYIELVQPGSSSVKQTTSRHVFKTGDRIRIHITSNGDGYLHAVHHGSSGQTKMLPVSAGGRVARGQNVVIPAEGGWLRFDEQKGLEKIDLLFSSHPAAAQEGLVPTGDPELVARVKHSIETYGASKDLVVYDQEGEIELAAEKDLVVEGRPYSASASAATSASPGAAHVERVRKAGSRPDAQTLAAPASYAVNTAGAPVVVKIRLRHR